RTRVYEALRATPRGDAHLGDASPWNLALARSNALLDDRFGRRARGQLKFAPLAVDRDRWIDMIEAWPEAVARTSPSRFRAPGKVAPEHLYPPFALAAGHGVRVPWPEVARHACYQPLNNVAILQTLGMARLQWLAPKFACLNDNFGAKPRGAAVAAVRRAL